MKAKATRLVGDSATADSEEEEVASVLLVELKALPVVSRVMKMRAIAPLEVEGSEIAALLTAAFLLPVEAEVLPAAFPKLATMIVNKAQ
jgi:hypothetical protein